MCLLLSHVFSLVPVYSLDPAYWEAGGGLVGGATAGMELKVGPGFAQTQFLNLPGTDRVPAPSTRQRHGDGTPGCAWSWYREDPGNPEPSPHRLGRY